MLITKEAMFFTDVVGSLNTPNILFKGVRPLPLKQIPIPTEIQPWPQLL